MCFSDIIFSGCSDVTGNLKKYLRIHFFFNFFFCGVFSTSKSISLSAHVIWLIHCGVGGEAGQGGVVMATKVRAYRTTTAGGCDG